MEYKQGGLIGDARSQAIGGDGRWIKQKTFKSSLPPRKPLYCALCLAITCLSALVSGGEHTIVTHEGLI